MASPRTVEQQRSAPSRFAKLHHVKPTTTEQRTELLGLAPDKRPVLGTWLSADGRTLYAYDGVSIRRVN